MPLLGAEAGLGPVAAIRYRPRALSFLFPDEASARTRRDRWLATLFVLFAVALVVRGAVREGGVLLRNQAWGTRFLEREDPYWDAAHAEREHGPYPPSFAYVTVPLAVLPSSVARTGWVVLQVGVLVFLLRLARRRTETHWPALAAHVPVIHALTLLLVSRYLLRDTGDGGGNMVYSALAIGGVDLALRGREWAGGVPLALSLVLKPNLVPLVLLLGLRGRWRAVLSSLLASVVLFCLPALYYGPHAYAHLAARWATDVVAFAELEDLHSRKLVPDGLPPAEDGTNQSLRDAVHRM